MLMKMLIKEYGSDFHYCDHPYKGQQNFISENSNISLFFSGRVALFNLLAFGIQKYGWKKVGFPSYYCHEVVDFCRRLPIEITYYTYNPLMAETEIGWEDHANS